jgi:hypothetical protein
MPFAGHHERVLLRVGEPSDAGAEGRRMAGDGGGRQDGGEDDERDALHGTAMVPAIAAIQALALRNDVAQQRVHGLWILHVDHVADAGNGDLPRAGNPVG